MVMSEVAETTAVSPKDVVPGARVFRDLPVNEMGAADFGALLCTTGEDEGAAEAVRGLLTDVAMDRIVQPIIVRPLGSGRYELVSGWLVWSAALYLHKESVQALLWDGSDLEAVTLAFRLNHHRLQMKRGESARMALQVARLLARHSEDVVTYRDVARALGCSPSWAHKLLSSAREGEAAEEAAAGRPGKGRRGRPPATLVFSFQLLDPRRWESSVRLRAVLQGSGPKELRFQRSEESEGWRDVSLQEFVSALLTETERLQSWLAATAAGENGIFPREKAGASRKLNGAQAPPVPLNGATNGKGERHAHPHVRHLRD